MSTTDKYGRLWDVSPEELCPVCGQPDNCGDCDHGELSDAEVLQIGGRLPRRDPIVDAIVNDGDAAEYDIETEDYAGLIESIAHAYEARITAFLERLRAAVIEQTGLPCGDVVEWSDDNYRWAFSTIPNGSVDDDSIDFTLEIGEAVDFGDDAPGVSFGLNIVRYSGEMLGGFQPFNYTPACWVDARDDYAVAARWRLFDEVDMSDVGGLL